MCCMPCYSIQSPIMTKYDILRWGTTHPHLHRYSWKWGLSWSYHWLNWVSFSPSKAFAMKLQKQPLVPQGCTSTPKHLKMLQLYFDHKHLSLRPCLIASLSSAYEKQTVWFAFLVKRHHLSSAICGCISRCRNGRVTCPYPDNAIHRCTSYVVRRCRRHALSTCVA